MVIFLSNLKDLQERRLWQLLIVLLSCVYDKNSFYYRLHYCFKVIMIFFSGLILDLVYYVMQNLTSISLLLLPVFLAANPKFANDAEYEEKNNEVNLLLHKTFVAKSYVNGSVT